MWRHEEGARTTEKSIVIIKVDVGDAKIAPDGGWEEKKLFCSFIFLLSHKVNRIMVNEWNFCVCFYFYQ